MFGFQWHCWFLCVQNWRLNSVGSLWFTFPCECRRSTAASPASNFSYRFLWVSFAFIAKTHRKCAWKQFFSTCCRANKRSSERWVYQQHKCWTFVGSCWRRCWKYTWVFSRLSGNRVMCCFTLPCMMKIVLNIGFILGYSPSVRRPAVDTTCCRAVKMVAENRSLKNCIFICVCVVFSPSTWCTMYGTWLLTVKLGYTQCVSSKTWSSVWCVAVCSGNCASASPTYQMFSENAAKEIIIARGLLVSLYISWHF